MDRLHIEFDIDLMDDLFERAKQVSAWQEPLRTLVGASGVVPTVTIIPAQPAEPARRTRGPNKPKTPPLMGDAGQKAA